MSNLIVGLKFVILSDLNNCYTMSKYPICTVTFNRVFCVISTDMDYISDLSVRGRGEDWHEEVHRGEELSQVHADLAHVL